MTKQVAVIGAAVMTTLLALVALWQFHIVVVYVLVSLALAATVRPLVQYWSGQGFVKRMMLFFLFLIGVVIFGFLLFLTAETAINELEVLFRTVSTQDEWNLPRWLQGSSFQEVLAARLPSPSELFEAFTGDEGQLVLPAIIGFTQGIGDFVSGALVILFLSIYWSINQIHFERLWLSLLPSDQRKQARGVWRTIELEVGAYIRRWIMRNEAVPASSSKRAMRYLPWRCSPVSRRCSSAARTALGDGSNTPPQRISWPVRRRPVCAADRARPTLSTSGSSGTTIPAIP